MSKRQSESNVRLMLAATDARDALRGDVLPALDSLEDLIAETGTSFSLDRALGLLTRIRTVTLGQVASLRLAVKGRG